MPIKVMQIGSRRPTPVCFPAGKLEHPSEKSRFPNVIDYMFVVVGAVFVAVKSEEPGIAAW